MNPCVYLQGFSRQPRVFKSIFLWKYPEVEYFEKMLIKHSSSDFIIDSFEVSNGLTEGYGHGLNIC